MTHIWTAPILGTSVGETSKKAKTEDPSEKVSVLKELAPDEAL